MKAKYFMVGDWVLDDEGTPFRVAQVNDACFSEHSSDLMLEDGDIYTDVKPIPLTAEILEKNGFVRSSVFVEWKYEEEGVYILWKPFPFLKIETENVQLNLSGCEYVHELQNALRLCGINKTIEI